MPRFHRFNISIVRGWGYLQHREISYEKVPGEGEEENTPSLPRYFKNASTLKGYIAAKQLTEKQSKHCRQDFKK